MGAAVLCELARDRPPAAFAVDVLPTHSGHFAAALARQEPHFEHRSHQGRLAAQSGPYRPDFIISQNALTLSLGADLLDPLAGIDGDDLPLDAPVVDSPHDLQGPVCTHRGAAIGDLLKHFDHFPALNGSGFPMSEAGQDVAIEGLPVLVPGSQQPHFGTLRKSES